MVQYQCVQLKYCPLKHYFKTDSTLQLRIIYPQFHYICVDGFNYAYSEFVGILPVKLRYVWLKM